MLQKSVESMYQGRATGTATSNEGSRGQAVSRTQVPLSWFVCDTHVGTAKSRLPFPLFSGQFLLSLVKWTALWRSEKEDDLGKMSVHAGKPCGYYQTSKGCGQGHMANMSIDLAVVDRVVVGQAGLPRLRPSHVHERVQLVEGEAVSVKAQQWDQELCVLWSLERFANRHDVNRESKEAKSISACQTYQYWGMTGRWRRSLTMTAHQIGHSPSSKAEVIP